MAPLKSNLTSVLLANSNKTLCDKFIAVVVAVAVLTVYSTVALAAPGAVSGELSVSGEVVVNGQHAISGGTIFSDSAIVTGEQSSATVSLGGRGRIELRANSNLRLGFADKSIVGRLDAGSARVSTLTGVLVNLTTKDGGVEVDGSQATSFTVNTETGETVVATEWGLAELTSRGDARLIAAGENGAAGAPLPQQFIVSARLVTKDNKPITVNGASASSGATILTGAIIETPDQVGATINIASLGSLDIAPNTKMVLAFDQNGNIKVTLIRGCVIVRTRKNAIGEVDTSQGPAGKTERKKRVLNVCFLAGATAPVVKQSTAFNYWWLLLLVPIVPVAVVLPGGNPSPTT